MALWFSASLSYMRGLTVAGRSFVCTICRGLRETGLIERPGERKIKRCVLSSPVPLLLVWTKAKCKSSRGLSLAYQVGPGKVRAYDTLF